MPSTNSLKIEQTPIFIDFEASSLDLLSSYPIEVGICLPSGETRSWLIKPHVLWKDWSEKAARIHGISKATLQEEGQEISEVIKELNSVISGTAYCDAWAFDSFWMHRLFKAGKCKSNFELDSITSILDSEQIDQWQDIRAGVIDESKLVRHRAANDALILHKTWKKIGASL
ncbi:MAG: DNA polymerase III epsilon subunit-like protein [Oleiphilaceae bacterium]|jgi:DNA polymerase III epsilon subunit-like protein